MMTIVGVIAALQAKASSEDYLLAGRSVNPIATALSAVSSCHSAYMFIGFIGFTYLYGISSLCFVLTWVVGDLIVWLKIYKPLREQSQKLETKTITSFLGTSEKQKFNLLIKIASFVSFVFLAVYAAAQLKAGAKALTAMLDFDYQAGIILGALIVIVYCFSGGIRASIWTDVVQSIIMFVAMLALLFIAVSKVGGLMELFDALKGIDPNLVSIKPSYLDFPFWLFLLALFANGIGVVGQPHVMVRAMALDSSSNLGFARNIYISWYLLFSLAAIGVGLAARVLLPDLVAIDGELTLPILSMELLPQILSGLILAGIFSSVVSTADSQVLSCSASLTQDLFQRWQNSYMMSKFATLLTTSLVLVIALSSYDSVFSLVMFAWSALAVSIGSLVMLKCLGQELSEKTAILMMTASITMVVWWKYFSGLSESIHEALPGFILAFGIYYLSKLFKR